MPSSNQYVASRSDWRAAATSQKRESVEVAQSRLYAGGLAAFRLALAFLFIRLAFVHELLGVALGVNTYLLYFVGVPALVAYVADGGLKRTFSFKSAKWWTIFWIWMFVTVPFSYWKSASLDVAFSYAKTPLILFLLLTGFAARPRALEAITKVGFVAGLVNLAATARYGESLDYADRLSMPFGVMGNANDWAAHMLFMLPFFVLPLFLPRSPVWMKVLGIPGALGAVYIVLSTGSRGAAVSLAVQVLLALVLMNWKKGLAVILLIGMSAIVMSAVVSNSALDRIWSLVDSSKADQSSLESTESREEFFRQSIRLTVENPAFGVGPGQFMTALGVEEGMWKASHNSYTQISSEMGLPGAFFFIMGFGGGLWGLWRVRKAQQRLDGSSVLGTQITFVFLAVSGMAAAAVFLNLGYTLYFPLASAFAAVARTQLVLAEESAGAATRHRQPAHVLRTS